MRGPMTGSAKQSIAPHTLKHGLLRRYRSSRWRVQKKRRPEGRRFHL